MVAPQMLGLQDASNPRCSEKSQRRIAVLSPSFSAPSYGPQVHEQAMVRLAKITGCEIVEYPTTRQPVASPQERARDLGEAFADPTICAVMSTVGGNDQITVLPYMREPDGVKPFFGYSDNTHLLNWLWHRGIQGCYGGSTQVHLGAGPCVDSIHERSLKAALAGECDLEITDPGYSEDFGKDWQDPSALNEFGERMPTEPWLWGGPDNCVSGRTWGGCVEVLMDIFMAGALKDDASLNGGILLLETSEGLIDPGLYSRFLRAIGERGLLGRLSGLMFARPPASSFDILPPVEMREAYRRDLMEMTLLALQKYNPEAVCVAGVPFGHTRPQCILPYGGKITLDGKRRRVFADYSQQV